MNDGQIGLYVQHINKRQAILRLALIAGLMFEAVSIYFTYTNKEIVEQGAIPALIAITCIGIWLLGRNRWSERLCDLYNKKYIAEQKEVLGIKSNIRGYTVNIEGLGEIKISNIVGTIYKGDTVTLLYWYSHSCYDIVQYEYSEEW